MTTNTNNAVAIRDNARQNPETHRSNTSLALPTGDQLATMLQFSEVAVKSGLLPGHIKTPQAAFAVIQTGQELGIPPMAALRGIYVINGKPTCDAALMQALIYRDHGDAALMPVESTNEKCTYRFKRAGWSEYQEFTYTKDDAAKAGLWESKGPWSTYPRDMLRSRCISVIARMAFQDTISALYTPEELGAEVDVRDGEIHVVSLPLSNGVSDDLDGDDIDYDPFQNPEEPAEEPKAESAADRLASRIDAADSMERIAEILNWISKNKAKLGDDYQAMYKLAKDKRDELKGEGAA